jgi:hypothetical protein
MLVGSSRSRMRQCRMRVERARIGNFAYEWQEVGKY